MQINNFKYSFKRKELGFLSPICWWNFFRTEWKEQKFYRKHLSGAEKKEIKRERKGYILSFLISGALHAILLIGLYNGLTSNLLLSSNLAISGGEVDFELIESIQQAQLDPVYDKNSTIIIDPSSLRPPQKSKLLALNKLIKGLKLSKNSMALTPRVSRERKSSLESVEKKLKAGLSINRHGRRFGNKKIVPQRVKLWDSVQLFKADVGRGGYVNYAEIMRVIDKHSFYFRDCYEKALLKDEELSIKAVFVLSLNQAKVQKTKLNLQGNGNPQSRRVLARCLFQNSKTLVFAKNKRNMSVKFNLIFGI